MTTVTSALMHGTTLGRLRAAPIELPFVQIAFEGDRYLTLSPVGLRDFFTAQTMAFARDQPIDDEAFKKLANALRVELDERLRFAILETVIGTTLMVVHGWHSPRALQRLLKDLRRDALATIDKAQGDRFAEFVIATIQQEIAETKLPMRKVIDRHIEALSEVIKPGKPDEEARSVFFEAITQIARRNGDTLALPPRGDDRELRSTPFFEFAAGARDIVVAYGNAILDRRGLPRGRFDGFELDRDALVRRLERARAAISRETSDTYP
jgi:hypothetical protein